MEHERNPLVSIGIPVFNGERGLARCLEGLLSQDYPNLEVVISDNASTDETPSICQRYLAIDSRVKYQRSEQNRGGAWNFNRVFELSSGEYFMWAAHDDEREPMFVSACVERLEGCPDAVLCQAQTVVSIEGHDQLLYVASLDSFDERRGVVDRYRETLKRFPATAVYGLYRSSAMRKTKLWSPVIASDMAFIQELSVYGQFIQVPRRLFVYRGRHSWNTIHQDALYFLGRRKPWWYVPFVMLMIEHVRRIARSSIPLGVKVRLAGVLVVHETGEVLLKILLKTTGAFCPARWKRPVGRAVYNRWMHNPNLHVLDNQLYFDRVCRPQLGWWR